MNYEILETHCVYENGKLIEVAVLWKDKESVRATYSNLTPKSGYKQLSSNENLSSELFQSVAGEGAYVDEERRKKYFSGKKNWSR